MRLSTITAIDGTVYGHVVKAGRKPFGRRFAKGVKMFEHLLSEYISENFDNIETMLSMDQCDTLKEYSIWLDKRCRTKRAANGLISVDVNIDIDKLDGNLTGVKIG